MADEKNSGDKVLSLVASLTSPAKLGFAAYVLLVYFEKIDRPNVLVFVAVTLAFIVVQIVHDDYVRILLNRAAERELILWKFLAVSSSIFIVLAVIALLGARHTSLPQSRAWTASAVSAQQLAGILREQSLTLQYRLTNRTDNDFRIHIKTAPDGANLYQNDRRGLTPFVGFIDISEPRDTELAPEPLPPGYEPISFPDAVAPTELFLPAHSVVGLKVDSRFDREASPQQNLGELRRIGFAGFVIQDPSSRLHIDLPFSEKVIATFPPPPPTVIDRPPN